MILKALYFILFTFLFSLFTSDEVRAQNRPYISFVTGSIVRVQWRPDGRVMDNGTGVCNYDKSLVMEVDNSENMKSWRSSEIIVELGDNGALTFRDAKTGKVMLSEDPQCPHRSEEVVRERIIYDEASAHTEETANGQVTVKDIIRREPLGTDTRYTVTFRSEGEKALYGLGSHMEDYMNLHGKTMYLTQHNLKAMVPMLCSTKRYGLLFDVGCAMKFVSEGDKIEMQMEAADALDYYFIKGNTMEDVVGGYRKLTGSVSLMPRWLFGYTQSKERYVSADDIVETLREYRHRHVPIDMIVQDWNYWPEGWGYMKMDPKHYPDPKALADSVHAMNAKLMISIWPNPQWCPEAEDFKSKGMMLEHDVYDVFNPEARRHYWKYANDEFFSRGFDAWWCDSSEPLDGDWNKLPPPINGKPYSWDDHAYRWELNKSILSEALGSKRSSLYSLYHSMGIYENQRLATSSKRVVNLTRSSYAGQQRYGTVVWNGDTHASWESFRQQIPSGLNYMATGNPYWTVDVGSFFTRNDQRRWFYTGAFDRGVEDDEYKEYYVRMFQWGTFLPMLRSHGSDTPREIWRFGEPGTKYYDAILKMINLRYKLIPYIYNMAARQAFGSYTMARPLAFDFPDDERVHDLKDEYMFGDILVCPVTQPGVSTRSVYLPKGDSSTTWYDYWTNKTYTGGQTIEASSALDTLPLFVRAGSILTTTDVAEYSDAQKDKTTTFTIYPGADAETLFYEDKGDGYGYENEERSMVTLSWDDANRTLTMSYRDGTFKELIGTRWIGIRLIGGKNKMVQYNGKQKIVKF